MLIAEVARAIWAKTDPDLDGSMSLPRHLLDSAAVAELLWDRWLSPHVRSQIGTAAGSATAGRALVVFLAGGHDVGKASPAFEVQGPPHVLEQVRAAGLPLDPRVALRRRQLPHGLAGQVALEDWLQSEHGFQRAAARPLGIVVGGHHGTFTSPGQTRGVDPTLLGTGPWHQVRHYLLDEIAGHSGAINHFAVWRRDPIPAPVQVLLTGVVIVADWIASNAGYFPYEDDPSVRHKRATAAWQRLSLPTPWAPQGRHESTDHLLRTRFALPARATARPVQHAALEIVDAVDSPGLLIIEAPTGIGKTEAGLLAAEHLAARLGQSGIFFALPSVATSNAIFTRILAWVGRLPELQDGPASVHLAHSKAGLNDEFVGLSRHGRMHAVHDESDGAGWAVAHQWLSGRKKGLLADFAVGTIDQVLMMALKSKHLALRHLGLAGKVVVIDEVHAADEYMAVYLDAALEWLGAYQVPVVMLSATLPSARRAAMLAAYDRGRGTYVPPRRARRQPNTPVATPYDEVRSDRRYPLITATSAAAPDATEVSTDGAGRTFTVHPLSDDATSLIDLLSGGLVDGGCAVVIRNTVTRAQETFEQLVDVFGTDVSLMHSRFVATDRLVREKALLRLFGAPGADTARPHRHIVVATQVVEQSLDIDFDLLVTDAAPVDLVLQRAGRLHRHDRERPLRLRQARVHVTGVDWSQTPPAPENGSTAIYGLDALLRSLAVLKVPSHPVISLPDDVPELVQTAYADVYPIPTGWEATATQASEAAAAERLERTRRAGAFLIGRPDVTDVTGWTDVGVDVSSEAKARAAVRDGRESMEVVVVQRRADHQLYQWGTDPDEPPISTEFVPDPSTARAVSACTVPLPPALTRPWQIDRTLTALEQTFVGAWQASPWLRGELVLVLDEQGRTTVADYELTYDTAMGLRHGRTKQGEAS